MMPVIQIYKNQVYICVGSEPYHRRDGTKTQLLHWKSACDTCGKLFVFKVPAAAAKFWPNRRCSKHKSPGLRAGGATIADGGAK